MAKLNVTIDAEVDQLIADLRRTMRELAQIARSDKDVPTPTSHARRQQAQRWLDAIIKFADYAVECRDNARRGR